MSIRRALVAMTLALFAVALCAQEESAPAFFGERVDVEVVNVDVVVTDGDGNRVTDLGRDEFELRIDGKPVPIEYFSSPATKVAEPGLAAEGVSAIDLPSRAPAEPNSQIVVFVDQSALEVRTSSEIIEQIGKFVLPRLDGTVEVLVAAFVDKLQVLVPLTSDRSEVERALDELAALRGRGSLLASERRRLQNEIRGFGNVPLDPLRAQQYIEAERRRLEADVRAFGERSLDRQRRSVEALENWVNALAAIDGRKSVLLATDGYASSTASSLQALVDLVIRSVSTTTPPVKERFNTTDELASQETGLLVEYEEMLRAAQNARVAFYTISPRTPPTIESTAELGRVGGETAPSVDRDRVPVESSSSVVRLAAATGGRNLYLDANLSRNLVQVVADEDALYSLGFTTGEAAGGKDHKVEVRILRPGLSVRHRDSYRRRSVDDRAEEALSAAVSLNAVSNPLGLSVELGPAEPAEKKGKGSVVPLLVRIPLRGLALVPTEGGLRGRLSARVAILGAHRELRTGTPSPIEVQVAAADAERIATHNWAYRAEMRLAPGVNRVAVVLVDEVGGAISAATASIEIAGKR